MSKKLTAKQAKYCHYRAYEGMNQSAAYRKAYNVGPDTKPETVWRKAAEVEANGKVTARIEEIQEEIAEALNITEQSVLAGLKHEATTAKSDGARVQAYGTIAKIRGFNTKDRDVADMTDEEIRAELAVIEQERQNEDTVH